MKKKFNTKERTNTMKTTLTFHSCGLNPENNILEAQLCPCGCGHYGNLILQNDKEVADFIGSMLAETDCHHCAIFAVKQNGDLIFGQKTDEDIICYAAKDGKAIETIIDLNEQINFHCYGLLQQVDDDLYAIIMD